MQTIELSEESFGLAGDPGSLKLDVQNLKLAVMHECIGLANHVNELKG
jgi:hypothetical protein